jgi:hypothetical protein
VLENATAQTVAFLHESHRSRQFQVSKHLKRTINPKKLNHPDRDIARHCRAEKIIERNIAESPQQLSHQASAGKSSHYKLS